MHPSIMRAAKYQNVEDHYFFFKNSMFISYIGPLFAEEKWNLYISLKVELPMVKVQSKSLNATLYRESKSPGVFLLFIDSN